MRTARPALQVAPYAPVGTLGPRTGPLVGRTYSRDAEESTVLQGVALALAAAEAAAGAGPGTPAEAAPLEVGRAPEFHRAHLQGSARPQASVTAASRQWQTDSASLPSGGVSLSPAVH